MTRSLITAVTVGTVAAVGMASAAITPIPPSEYPRGCHPSEGGEAHQGDAADDRMSGSLDGDLLRGGPGDDKLSGWFGADCLFGQAGDDVAFAGRR